MKILQYDDLVKISLSENNEPLVDLRQATPEVLCVYEKQDMIPLVGDRIFVRQSVAEKIRRAGAELIKGRPEAQFKVVYGYRAPEIQEKYFEERKQEIKKTDPEITEDKLIRQTHLHIAVPDVAGHPTGGAIDITITTPEGDLDMGTKIADFSAGDKIETFASGLTEEQQQNRKLLHDLLVKQGFAPFYGEWWHFSFGDREWAAFYNQPQSLYSPTEKRG